MKRKESGLFFFAIGVLFLTPLGLFAAGISNELLRQNAMASYESLVYRAENLERNGDFEQSLQLVKEALHFAQASGDQLKESFCLASLARLEWNLGRIQESTALYDQARRLSLANRTVDLANECAEYLKINRLYLEAKQLRDRGCYQESIARFGQAIDTAKNMKSPGHEIKCLRQLSFCYLDTEDLQGFYEANSAALELARKINHKAEQARCLNNIGTYYLRISSYAKAIYYYEEAANIANKFIPGSELESQCLSNIGATYKKIGNIDKSIEYMNKSLQIDYYLGNPIDISIDLNNLGAAYRTKAELRGTESDYERSLNFLMEALKYAIRTQSVDRQIDVLNNIGLANFSLGKIQEASDYFQRALNKSILEKDFYSQANISSNLGFVLLNLGNSKKAKQYFLKSIEGANKTNAKDILWEAYFGLGQCFEREHDYARALEYYKKSQDIIDQLRSLLSLDDQRAGFARDKWRVYEATINLLYRLEEKDGKDYGSEIFLAAERAKARGLLDDMNLRKLYFSNGDLSLQREQEEISRKISLTLSELAKAGLSREQRQILAARLEKEEAESLSIMNRIKSQKIDERGSLSYEVGSIGRIQAWLLAEKAAILEFFLGEYQSFSFFIHRDGFKIRALPPRKDIENSLRAYLKILSTPPQEGFQGHKAARRLYLDFLSPFEKELSSVDHLIVIPDGILNYLPFETLIRSYEGNRSRPKYLIERMKISYAPSASFMDFLFRQPAEKKNSKTLLALGNPLYSVGKKKNTNTSAGDALREVYLENGFDFSPLPHSKEEVLAISRRFQKDTVDVFLHERAKEEIVKNSEIRDYQILHFACHSFLDEKFPFRSALVLTLDDDEDEDGFLQGREIYGLELKADLVVLSACQTGKGKLEDAEGVLGLPRIFFNSGAKAVVSSLWKVNDKSTSDLMREFYFHLSTGKDKAHALRLAKLTMLSSKYAHPFYWAGFILNGDYRTLTGF